MIDTYVALDIETTGLNPARDKVLEIGAVKVRKGVVEQTYETLVNTGVSVPEQIQELTGITNEMQKTGKNTETAVRELIEFCEDLPILGHNIQFDFSFLKQNAINFGIEFEKDALDTLKIARHVLTELPSRTLVALCEYYQVDVGKSHRALDDAFSAHKVLWKMWEEFKDKAPEAFSLHKLNYSAKKQGPITKSQKVYLNDLMKYHKIESDFQIEKMTKNEASRMIDHILLQYGKIIR